MLNLQLESGRRVQSFGSFQSLGSYHWWSVYLIESQYQVLMVMLAVRIVQEVVFVVHSALSKRRRATY